MTGLPPLFMADRRRKLAVTTDIATLRLYRNNWAMLACSLLTNATDQEAAAWVARDWASLAMEAEALILAIVLDPPPERLADISIEAIRAELGDDA